MPSNKETKQPLWVRVDLMKPYHHMNVAYSHAQDTISIWPIVGTLTSTTTSGKGGPESNGNEWVFWIPQRSRTEEPPKKNLFITHWYCRNCLIWDCKIFEGYIFSSKIPFKFIIQNHNTYHVCRHIIKDIRRFSFKLVGLLGFMAFQPLSVI